MDLLQPILSSNCRKDDPETSKSQLSAYLGFSADTMSNQRHIFGFNVILILVITLYYNVLTFDSALKQFGCIGLLGLESWVQPNTLFIPNCAEIGSELFEISRS